VAEEMPMSFRPRSNGTSRTSVNLRRGIDSALRTLIQNPRISEVSHQVTVICGQCPGTADGRQRKHVLII